VNGHASLLQPRFDQPRTQALLSALTVFRLLPAGFTNANLRTHLKPLLNQPNLSTGAMTYDLRRLHPQEWQRFAAAVPESLRHLPLVDAYAELLCDPDPGVQEWAAAEWVRWDHAQMGVPPGRKFDDPAVRLQFARIVTHYWRHGAFLDGDQLLNNAHRLNGIPGILVQGVNDVSCPPDRAWELAKEWKTAELELNDAGHGRSDSTPDAFPTAITAALDRLRRS
jgi:proline iminopeptidase